MLSCGPCMADKVYPHAPQAQISSLCCVCMPGAHVTLHTIPVPQMEIWHPRHDVPLVGYVGQQTGWSVVGTKHPCSTVILCRDLWPSSKSNPVEEWVAITFWTFAASDYPKPSLQVIAAGTVSYASESHHTRYLNILCSPQVRQKGKPWLKVLACVWSLFHSSSWQMLPAHHSYEFWNHFRTITDSAHFSPDRSWRSVHSATWLKKG